MATPRAARVVTSCVWRPNTASPFRRPRPLPTIRLLLHRPAAKRHCGLSLERGASDPFGQRKCLSRAEPPRRRRYRRRRRKDARARTHSDAMLRFAKLTTFLDTDAEVATPRPIQIQEPVGFALQVLGQGSGPQPPTPLSPQVRSCRFSRPDRLPRMCSGPPWAV